jgi:NADPH-dependent 2,4-dienoyl-CoA reductase/sulfur reductase-like enzyme
MSRNNLEQVVILGNGGAAIHAIKALRGVGFKGSIEQISNTIGDAFNPMLGPYFLKGILTWEQCFPYGRNFYKDYDVVCHFGSPVEHIDTKNRKIFLANGKIIKYDQCLVATGASVVVPPIPGLKDSSHALALRTPESTLAMHEAMQRAHGKIGKVVVLGASLVGVKVAEILNKMGVNVILLDVTSQLLPRGAHPETAEILKNYYASHGIDVRLGCSLEGIESKEDCVCCFLPDATMEEADFIAVCTGIRPNHSFLDPDEVEIDMAVVVDKHMQTSASGLYAAGDVSQGNNPLTARNEWLGTWNNACCQGRVAGLNMAGISMGYEGIIPQHISPIYDWNYAQLGDVNRRGDTVRVERYGHPTDGDGYRLCVYEGDVLVGANIINRMQDLNILKKSIVLKRNWPVEQFSKFSFTD